MQFEDHVVVVTGGTRGIGKAITMAFAQQGAKVVALYHSNQEYAQELLQVIQDHNFSGSVEVKKAAVNDFQDIKQTIYAIKREKGHIDILVNNAGVFKTGYLAVTRACECEQTIDVNLKGTIYCTMSVIRIMMQQKGGIIINMASINGITPFAGAAVYAASKAGIIAFTKAMAEELAVYGIIVTGVAPGLVDTDMINTIEKSEIEKYYTKTNSTRLLTPEEVAKLVLNHATPDARSLQGQTIIVKG